MKRKSPGGAYGFLVEVGIAPSKDSRRTRNILKECGVSQKDVGRQRGVVILRDKGKDTKQIDAHEEGN